MVKKKETQATKLAVFATLLEGFRLYRQKFLLLTKLALVVAIPVGILQLIQVDGFDGNSSIISSIAWGYALLAFLYVALAPELANQKASAIYTRVSGRFLQYIIIALVLILCALPLVVALVVFVLLIPVYGLPIVVLAPLGLLCVGLSVYLYTHFALALPAVAIEEGSSFSSLMLASKMTRKNRLRITTLFILLFIIVIGLLTGVATLVSLSQTLNESSLFNTLIYILESAIFMPVIMCMLAVMYKRLS
jgi:hypothetical protein